MYIAAMRHHRTRCVMRTIARRTRSGATRCQRAQDGDGILRRQSGHMGTAASAERAPSIHGEVKMRNARAILARWPRS